MAYRRNISSIRKHIIMIAKEFKNTKNIKNRRILALKYHDTEQLIMKLS